MNLSSLIKQYFPSSNNEVTIDVFDEKNIYDVYQRVVSALTQHIDIETTVLQAKDELKHITKSDFWQGTIIYLQLYTNKEINPAEVVANRTNVAEQYNELFLNDNELEELW